MFLFGSRKYACNRNRNHAIDAATFFPFSERRWFFWLSNFTLSAAESASSLFVQHQRESYSCDLGSRPYLFRLAKHKCFPAPVSLTHRECQITLLRSTFSSSTKSITAKMFLRCRAWQSGSPISLQETKPQRSVLGNCTGHTIAKRERTAVESSSLTPAV